MTHTDTGTALVGAPPAAVFAALPGGGYRMVLAYDDPKTLGKSGANTDVSEVRFAVVEPPTQLVEECDFISGDPRFGGTMTMTWTLDAVRTGTLVTITATDVPDGIGSAEHATAFASTLGNLDVYLREHGGAG